MESIHTYNHREQWNKGKLVGPNAPFKLKAICAIRTRFKMAAYCARLTFTLVQLQGADHAHGSSWPSKSYWIKDCLAAIPLIFIQRSVQQYSNISTRPTETGE